MPDAHPLRAGDPSRLGAYEILGRLGEGGQGSVFLGEAEDGYVAIKLMHAGSAADPAARARFVRELEVAKQVARFCTAQILGEGVAGDRPYIVSEFVPGSSLHQVVLAEGPRTGGALDRLAISTLTALTAIHQAGIVHRDFKPHNVMLGPDGPRVIDFGVARALGTGETQNVGTPAYMAPEHFDGSVIGPPADMFAWGTTMVFAATGRPAFGNDEMGAVMSRIMTREPDLSGLAEPLREVVRACLVKDPRGRPTAKEAQERLVGVATAPHQVVAVPVYATAPGEPRTPRKPWVLVPLLVGALIAGVAVVGGLAWAASSGDGEPEAKGSDAVVAPGAQGQGGVRQPGGLPGGAAPEESLKPPSAGPSGTTAPKTSPKPGATKPRPKPGQGGGGGGGSSEPPNPYTPQQVCNSGGHGGGYYVQRSAAFAGGTAFQLYNGSGYNCAVTMKTKSVGKRSSVWTRIERKDGKGAEDRGSFEYYAGPAFVYGKGQCVRYAGGAPGGSTTASWDNCG